ncbi:MAG: hypothetical protein ACI399_06985 [Candidatus Cryptobacteroides sp.]
MTKRTKMLMLLILQMIASFSFTLSAYEPPFEEIVPTIEGENPSEESLELVVYLNTVTGQITVETNLNQWNKVSIINIDTGVLFSVEIIRSTQNDDYPYCTQAPSFPGNYCILFENESTEVSGYFTIV